MTLLLFSGLEQMIENCASCDVKLAPPPSKRKPPEQEAATSTTPSEPSNISESPVASLNKMPVPEWGIEEVIQFIDSTDPCLGVHADLFRKHVSIQIILFFNCAVNRSHEFFCKYGFYFEFLFVINTILVIQCFI